MIPHKGDQPDLYLVLDLGPMDTKNKVPYVAAALFCETIIHEKDDVITIVRMVDIYQLEHPKDLPPGVQPMIQPSLLVALKSGELTGKGEVAVSVSKPSGGKPTEALTFPVLLKGGGHGVNLISRLSIRVTEYGLYWFNVLWNGALITRIPLRIILQQEDQDSTKEAD